MAKYTIIDQSSQYVKVWDGFVRFFHWSIVTVVLLDYFVITDSNRWHEWIGYYALALVGLRVIWGFWGTHYARFSTFVPGPNLLFNYLHALIRRREPNYTGHNPAGAVMIMALLLLLTVIGVSGWMMGLDRFWGESWVEDLHYYSATGIIYLACIHILGVFYASWRHKHNLIKTMITGYKN